MQRQKKDWEKNSIEICGREIETCENIEVGKQ